MRCQIWRHRVPTSAEVAGVLQAGNAKVRLISSAVRDRQADSPRDILEEAVLRMGCVGWCWQREC